MPGQLLSHLSLFEKDPDEPMSVISNSAASATIVSHLPTVVEPFRSPLSSAYLAVLINHVDSTVKVSEGDYVAHDNSVVLIAEGVRNSIHQEVVSSRSIRGC